MTGAVTRGLMMENMAMPQRQWRGTRAAVILEETPKLMMKWTVVRAATAGRQRALTRSAISRFRHMETPVAPMARKTMPAPRLWMLLAVARTTTPRVKSRMDTAKPAARPKRSAKRAQKGFSTPSSMLWMTASVVNWVMPWNWAAACCR